MKFISILEILEKEKIFHCDAKLENICLNKNYKYDNSIYLIDFGLSEINSIKNQFSVKGTPYFISPYFIISNKYDYIDDLIHFFYSVYNTILGKKSKLLQFSQKWESLTSHKCQMNFYDLAKETNSPSFIILGNIIDQYTQKYLNQKNLLVERPKIFLNYQKIIEKLNNSESEY